MTEEQRQSSLEVPAAREELDGPLFAYIHEFRFQPPPLYSEVAASPWRPSLISAYSALVHELTSCFLFRSALQIDPNPDHTSRTEERRLDACPSR